MEEHANNRIAKAEEILEFLTATLRGEVTEEVVVGGFGKSATEKIIKNVDLRDRLKAAELLGKRYRLFTDKVEVEGVVPVMIVGESELEEQKSESAGTGWKRIQRFLELQGKVQGRKRIKSK